MSHVVQVPTTLAESELGVREGQPVSCLERLWKVPRRVHNASPTGHPGTVTNERELRATLTQTVASRIWP